MVHVVAALISLVVGYIFNVVTRLFAKIRSIRECESKNNDIIDVLQEMEKYYLENNQVLADLEELSREIILTVRHRKCSKTHFGNVS